MLKHKGGQITLPPLKDIIEKVLDKLPKRFNKSNIKIDINNINAPYNQPDLDNAKQCCEDIEKLIKTKTS